MTPTHATKNKTKRYRYYVCNNASSRGWHNCPAPSVPAPEVEQFVIDQIKCIGKDSDLLAETIEESRHQRQDAIKDLEAENRTLDRDLRRHNEALRKLVSESRQDEIATDRLADLQDNIRAKEQRATEIREKIIVLSRELVDAQEIAQACTLFDPVWETLTPREQTRVLRLLIERVSYNGNDGNIAITFHPTGIKTLADELKQEAMA
jgi:site-specific DNA recombinase